MSVWLLDGSERGAALLLVLGAVAILSLAVAAMVGLVVWEQEEAIRQGSFLQARACAEAGIAVGMHPGVTEKWDPVLRQQFDDGSSFEVDLGADNGRLAINALLLQGQEVVLERLFRSWGLKDQDARRLIDHLADWVDGDGMRRLNGGEREAYEARGFRNMPLNRPFTHLQEMSWVIGMEELERLCPDWREFFTVWGDGKLNPNEAPFELLQAVLDLPDRDRARLEAFRDGPDEVRNTEDDGRFGNLDELRLFFAIPPGTFAALEPWLTLEPNLRRVISRGVSGRAECRITVVGNPETGPSGWRLWEER
ncbi:MAG: hypothetical protein OHK005_13290 [Candidatus Methylacidiphilales bacterium]